MEWSETSIIIALSMEFINTKYEHISVVSKIIQERQLIITLKKGLQMRWLFMSANWIQNLPLRDLWVPGNLSTDLLLHVAKLVSSKTIYSVLSRTQHIHLARTLHIQYILLYSIEDLVILSGRYHLNGRWEGRSYFFLVWTGCALMRILSADGSVEMGRAHNHCKG